MVEDRSGKVIEYLEQSGQATVDQIAGYLGISAAMVYRKLSRLIKEGKIVKFGKVYQIKGVLTAAQASRPTPGKTTSNPKTISQPQVKNSIPQPSAPKHEKFMPQTLDWYSWRQWLISKAIPAFETWLQQFNLRQRIMLVASVLLVWFLGSYVYQFLSPQGEITRLRQQINNKDLDLQKLNAQIYELQSQLNHQTGEVKSKTAGYNYQLEQINNLQGRLNASMRESQDWQAKFNRLDLQYKETQGQLISSKAQIEKFNQSNSALQQSLRQAKQEAEQAQKARDVALAQKTKAEAQAAALLNQPKPAKLEPEPQQPQQPVTMGQIVQWSKEKVTDSVIIERIKTSRFNYSLTADDIHWLSSQGVSQPVIDAMQQAGKG